MNEALGIDRAVAAVDRLGVGVELDDVLPGHLPRRQRARHQEMAGARGVAHADMAVTVQHALVIEDVVGDHEIVDQRGELGVRLRVGARPGAEQGGDQGEQRQRLGSDRSMANHRVPPLIEAPRAFANCTGAGEGAKIVPMTQPIDTDVLVVGAGPVGLTLAMDLASRGVDVTVMETRHAGEPPNVKCNQVSARSMEIFRRLGIAGADPRHRAAGGIPQRRGLLRLGHRQGAVAHQRCRRAPAACAARRATTAGFRPRNGRTGSTSCSSSRSCSRMRRRSRASASSTARSSRSSPGRQWRHGIARDLDSGERITITCRYLVGLRRRPLDRPPRHRRRACRHPGGAARAVDLFSRAGADGSAAGRDRPGCISPSIRAAAAP